VLELAVGTGRNLPLYPEVLRATAVELSPEMLALARARAAELGVEVDLRLGDAQALEFEDARFETVLITWPSERVRARSDRPSADESTSQRALA